MASSTRFFAPETVADAHGLIDYFPEMALRRKKNNENADDDAPPSPPAASGTGTPMPPVHPGAPSEGEADRAAELQSFDEDSDDEELDLTQRSDVADASNRMGTKFGSRREIKKLMEYLSDQEQVSHLCAGQYGGGQGLLALTSARLLFIKHGRMKQTLEDFPISKISSVQFSSGMALGTIIVFASGNKTEITNANKADGKALTDRLRDMVSDVPTGPAAAAPTVVNVAPAETGSPDLAAQISSLAALHQQGILSDDEFAAAKAKAISGI